MKPDRIYYMFGGKASLAGCSLVPEWPGANLRFLSRAPAYPYVAANPTGWHG